MSAIRKSKLVTLFLFLITVWILAPVTQAKSTHREFEFSEAPQLVCLTGILHPLGEKSGTGSDIFTIYIQGKKWWIFDVKKAWIYQGWNQVWQFFGTFSPQLCVW